jgi:hypothetical protein
MAMPIVAVPVLGMLAMLALVMLIVAMLISAVLVLNMPVLAMLATVIIMAMPVPTFPVPTMLVILVMMVIPPDGPQVPVQPGLLHQIPDLRLQQRQLPRIEHLDLVILIHQLTQLRQQAVRVGRRHGRGQMIDNHRMPATLRLRPLARVIDDERVKERHIAENRVRKAVFRQPYALSGQPLQRPVFPYKA